MLTVQENIELLLSNSDSQGSKASVQSRKESLNNVNLMKILLYDSENFFLKNLQMGLKRFSTTDKNSI